MCNTYVCRNEWIYLKAICHYRSLNSALYFVSGKVLLFATFVTYLLLGNHISTSKLFTCVALYEILRGSISLLLPWGVQYFMEAKDAILRIQVLNIETTGAFIRIQVLNIETTGALLSIQVLNMEATGPLLSIQILNMRVTYAFMQYRY